MKNKKIPENMKMSQRQKDILGITDEEEQFFWECHLRERRRNIIIVSLVGLTITLLLLLLLM